MGTPVKPPGLEYGGNCITCTPGLYPDGETPTKITVYFQDIEIVVDEMPSGEFLNACFVLDGDPDFPCEFAYAKGNVSASWDHTFGDCIWHEDPDLAYFESGNAQCENHVHNDYDDPESEDFINGTADAIIGDVPAIIAYDYGFVPIPEPFHEYMGPVNGLQVHRLAQINGKTCIYFKIDPTLVG